MAFVPPNEADIASTILRMGLDLRGSVAKVMFCSEMLQKDEVGPLNEQQKTFVQSIQNSSQWLARFEEMLTALAHIKTGTLTVEAVDLSECLQEGVKGINQEIKAKGQELIVEYIDKLPLVSANAFHLYKVVSSILSNAHQYTPKYGQIKVTAEVLDKKVMVTVSDTGIGIPFNDQKRVFDLLFRVNHPIVREHNGLGADLYFAKHYIESWGGNISVESVLNEGSKFWFTVPIAPTETDKPTI